MPECGLYHPLNHFPKRDVSYLKPIKAECQHLTGYSAVRLQWAPSFFSPGSLNLFHCLTVNRRNVGSLKLSVLQLWPQVPQQQRWEMVLIDKPQHCPCLGLPLCPAHPAMGIWPLEANLVSNICYKWMRGPASTKSTDENIVMLLHIESDSCILRHIIKAWKKLFLSISS